MTTGPRTVLVSMPFMDVDRPSIQLGLLRAIGVRAGFPVDTLHANLDLAALVGVERYRPLAEQRGRLLGDWLFSVEAFGTAAPDPQARLLDEFAADLGHLPGSPEQVRDRLRWIRDTAIPAFLDALLDDVDWARVAVVGFSCTFQQNAASFALARRLKRRYPGIVTLFGGAGFEGEMGLELVRTVDCVDLAVLGEADTAFPGLLAALAAGTDPGAVPGVARRVGARVVATPAAPAVEELDRLPPPDYDEYFVRAERLGLLPAAGRRDVWLPVETARGCWWGARHHCTFCGLNGANLRFRSKSPGRVRAELAGLAERYRSRRFEAVDNIMDPRYLRELFPALVTDGAGYEIFYEVKANLGRAQLALLAAAGVTHLQPGLESLSSAVLRLMDKGVRAAQNVNLLRWARYHGIDVEWNILWGFPGESAEEYAAQAAVAPHLVHLQPPVSADRFWLERFSPLHTRPGPHRFRHREPERSYRFVYPEGTDLDRVAYFFEYELVDALPDDAYAGLRRAVGDWRRAWAADRVPTLTYTSTPGRLEIRDGRHPDREGTWTFSGALADIYLACVERPTTAAAVRDRLGRALSTAKVEEAFDGFQRHGLLFRDENLALALALPV